MRRSVLISFLSLLLVCICVSSGLADARKLNLIFIGGDSDTEEGKNNLFRNMMISHEAFQEGAEAFFIKSAGRDYSNAAAIERTKAAEALLEDGSLNVVGGYSHGGQSIFFMEMDKISDLYLIDTPADQKLIIEDAYSATVHYTSMDELYTKLLPDNELSNSLSGDYRNAARMYEARQSSASSDESSEE